MLDENEFVNGEGVGGAPRPVPIKIPKGLRVWERTVYGPLLDSPGHNDGIVRILPFAPRDKQTELAQDTLQQDKTTSLESPVGHVEEIERTQSGRRAARRRSELPDPTKPPGHEVNKLDMKFQSRASREVIEAFENAVRSRRISKKAATEQALQAWVNENA